MWAKAPHICLTGTKHREDVEHGTWNKQLMKLKMPIIIKNSISCFLKDIHPVFKTSKNFHFVFSGRYWSYIQDFREASRRIFRIFVGPHLFHFLNLGFAWICKILILPKNNTCQLIRGSFLSYLECLSVPKDK